MLVNQLRPLLFVCYLLVLGIWFVSSLGHELWDDAYFYLRIARNFWEGHGLAYNPGQDPVYGITSQLYLLFALVIEKIGGGYSFLLTRLFAFGCLAGMYLTTRRWVEDTGSGNAPTGGTPAKQILHFSLMLLPTLSGLAASGMETVPFLWLMALFLDSYRKWSGTAPLWQAPLWLGIIYLARPDAALIPGVLSGGYFLAGGRRQLFLSTAGVAVVFTFIFGTAYAYYGTALPLPFYLKSAAATIYGGHFLRISAPDMVRHVFGFLILTAPVFWVTAVRLKDFRANRNWQPLLAPVAFFLFIGYHYISTVDVMGMQSRFFMPVWPLFVFIFLRAPLQISGRKVWYFLAAWGILLALLFKTGKIPNAGGWRLGRIYLGSYLVYYLAVGLALLWPQLTERLSGRILNYICGAGLLLAIGWFAHHHRPFGIERESINNKGLVETYLRRYTTSRGILELKQCVPELNTICHSEIGMPGLLLPETAIVDFAGLMNKDIATGNTRPVQACAATNPEAIFLPHRNYKRLNKRLKKSGLLKNYRRAVGKSSSPLFIRQDLWPDCEAPTERWRK